MVIYFAIKEVYEGEVPDRTCAELVRLIGQNCHRIVVDKTVNERYHSHLSELFGKPEYQAQAMLFLVNIVHNSQKFVMETSEPPELPPGVTGPMLHEDRYLVRAGLISRPIVVTAERGLLKAINKHHGLLGLKAITPSEALELAKDT